MQYTIFDKNTGEILRVHTTNSDPSTKIQNDNEYYVEGNVNGKTYLIDINTNEPVEKTDIPYTIDSTSVIADGVSTVTISNLPNPTRVMLKSVGKWVIEDGEFEFSIDTEGEYELKMMNPLYLDTTITITAVAE